MPDQEPITDTRCRIQAVALELFTTQGFEKTSLRQIADQLGVTKAALYYHFPSKVDLLRSVAQPFVDDVDALLDEAEAASSRSPREFLEAYFDLTFRHRKLWFALLRDPSALAHLDLVKRSHDWRPRFLHLLVGSDATLSQQARAIVAVSGIPDCVIALTDVPVDELRAATVDAACAALGLEIAGAAEQ